MQLLGTESTKKIADILTICLLVIFDSLLYAQFSLTNGAFPPARQAKTIHVEASTDTRNQGSMEMLEQLATEQTLRDMEFLGKTRFKLDLQNQTYFYDLTPAPATFVLAKDDPYEPPLEALIRIEALRRDFRAAVPTDNFWVVPLESIEGVVKACVRDLDTLIAGRPTSDAQGCSARIEAQFDNLAESISSFASVHKLTPSEPIRRRDPAPGYRVQIKISPPRARVRVMPLLEYKKNQYFKVPLDHYRWNDLLDSESDMIGWYHYRAEWPPELNGLEEGDFCIRKPGVITFKPPQN